MYKLEGIWLCAFKRKGCQILRETELYGRLFMQTTAYISVLMYIHINDRKGKKNHQIGKLLGNRQEINLHS